MTFNPEECERLARELAGSSFTDPLMRSAAAQLRAACAEVERLRRESSVRSDRMGAFSDGIVALQTDYQVERDKNAGLEMEVGKLRRLLTEANADRDRLAAENEAKEHLIGVLRGDIGVLAAENEALRKERDDLRADRKQFGEVLSKTNEALNRAGCFSALYYWEHIDAIAAERNSLRAEVEKCHNIIGRDADTIEGLNAQVAHLRDALGRLRSGSRSAVALLDEGAKSVMVYACRNTSSQCFCGMHVSQLDAALQPDGGERE